MTRSPIHPGEILADELEELQFSAAELGRELHVPTNRITQILAGKRAVIADTALRLGHWLGTGPELWMDLQKTYELRLAEQESGPRFGAPSYPELPDGRGALPRPVSAVHVERLLGHVI
jgi:antitoxin HigA-1